MAATLIETNQRGGHAMSQKCSCGHTHCCHHQTMASPVRTKNECGYDIMFDQVTCGTCGVWLRDENVRVPPDANTDG